MPDEPAILREQFETVVDAFRSMRTAFRCDFGFVAADANNLE